MNVKLAFDGVTRNRSDLLLVIADETEALYDIDDGEIAAYVERTAAAFRERRQKREALATFARDGRSQTVLVVWNPSLKAWNLWENVKTFVAHALRLARDCRYREVTLALNTAGGAPFVGKAVEGAIVGAYTFNKYQLERDEFLSQECQLTILVHPEHQADAEARKGLYSWLSENVNRCRDLINEPAAVVTPERLAEEAERIAHEQGLEIEILDPVALETRGYSGLLHVGQGSVHPPRMVVLRSIPAQATSETLALVGKGVTFDSGGISLKPGERMWEMKGDMAGAAAVLMTMRALGRLKPAVKVVGILCCAENLPDANAQRPGDIITAKNGKSIMVDNTDAEGRLILTDGLARAGEEGATHIIDIATLTGAVVRALGGSVAGVLGTDPRLVQGIIRSGSNHGEAFWELPLVEEYREALKSPFADINNIAAGSVAGAITGALFLREFVPENTAWAHLDIAGPIFKDKDWKHYEAGALGFGVKTLVDFCQRFREGVTEQRGASVAPL
jgi:leucyl aminopeptidase